MLTKIALTIVLSSIGFPIIVSAGVGSISGTVRDVNNNTAISGVVVKVQNTRHSALTDRRGHFRLANLPARSLDLVFIKDGYYALVVPDISVKENRQVVQNIQLYPGDPNEFLFLKIGSIDVTAPRNLLPDRAGSVDRINSGQIKHMQSNSLAGVLQHLPGNEMDGPFGLQRLRDVQIRTFESDPLDLHALFGTKIVVDDIPLSNNADLQTGVGVGYGTTVEPTGGRQYDLRTIPADHLQNVRVTSAAAPVEFGDLSQGLVQVETNAFSIPARLKLKNNPDTREANLMDRFQMLDTRWMYNLNYGYSERNQHISGDEYHRIAATLKSRNTFMNRRIRLNQQLRYNRKIEEDRSDADPNRTQAYNRDHLITYAQRIYLNLGNQKRLYIRNYVEFKRRNSWRRQLETPDWQVRTDRMKPGTREGIVHDGATYFSNVHTRGKEWSFGSKWKYHWRRRVGDSNHRFMTGIAFQGDVNAGSGKQFDLLRPPNGRLQTRPRSFDDIPGTYQLSVFGEDRIDGRWLMPYAFYLGLRMDSYNPGGIDLSGNAAPFRAQHGTFVNPRIGLRLKPWLHTQIRFAYSRSSKAPAAHMMYPEDFFLDVLDHTFRTETLPTGNDTTYRVPLISTYRYDRSSSALDGYQTRKFEASIDRQFGSVGISLTGYRQSSRGLPVAVSEPFTYHRYYWPQWPDSASKTIEETVVATNARYSRYQNVGRTRTNGLELRLRTHRIQPLHMRFQINAAFKFKRYGSSPYRQYGPVRSLAKGDTLSGGFIVPEDMDIIPYYHPTEHWRQKIVMHYILDYIFKPLGLWCTLRAQQVFGERRLGSTVKKREAKGYYHDGRHHTIDAETSGKMGLDQTFTSSKTAVMKRSPDHQWLFSIVVSKSLYQNAELSLFVENILNDRAYYRNEQGMYTARNPEIFWGIAFSTELRGLKP